MDETILRFTVTVLVYNVVKGFHGIMMLMNNQLKRGPVIEPRCGYLPQGRLNLPVVRYQTPQGGGKRHILLQSWYMSIRRLCGYIANDKRLIPFIIYKGSRRDGKKVCVLWVGLA